MKILRSTKTVALALTDADTFLGTAVGAFLLLGAVYEWTSLLGWWR